MAGEKASKDESAVSSILRDQAGASEGILRHDDDQRREKIERLRAAIADGTYNVSAEALADKMMESLAEGGYPEAEKENA